MATIIINKYELNNFVNDVIANDDNLISDMESVYEKFDAMLARRGC